jgi:hypothetical protein
MIEQDGRLVAQRRMLAELTKRDVTKMGSELAAKLDMSQVSSSELGAATAKIIRSVRLASGRFALMQNGKEFALVPWRQAMQRYKAKGFGIEARSGMSR